MTEDAHSETPGESSTENQCHPGHHQNVTATLLLFIAAAVVAGLLANVAINQLHGENGYFQFPEEVSARFPPMGQPIPPEVLELNERTLLELEYKNTVLSFMVIGLCLCSAVGVAAGISRRSVTGVIRGLACGVIAGATLGIMSGLASVFVGTNLLKLSSVDTMLQMMGAHAAGWMIIGAGIGLTVAAAQGEGMTAAAGRATAGGLLSGLLYLPVAGILFAADKSDQYVPDGNGNRVFWISLAGILVVATLTLSETGGKKPGATAPGP